MLNPPLDLPITVTEDGHWLWTGMLDPNGYGRHDRRDLAHRLVWSLCGFDLKKGKVLCHKDDICPHRNCVNPAHLYQGTQTENMKDAAKLDRLGHMTKMDAKKVAILQYLLLETKMTKSAICRAVGISPQWMTNFQRGIFKRTKPIAAYE